MITDWCMYTHAMVHVCMQEGVDLYKYCVQIKNPKAKKEYITIDWYGVTEKFETVRQLK